METISRVIYKFCLATITMETLKATKYLQQKQQQEGNNNKKETTTRRKQQQKYVANKQQEKLTNEIHL